MELVHLEPSEYVTCDSCGDEVMRPHIVWFGEMPIGMAEIEEAVIECDLFLVIGSSGHVYPAAGLVNIASVTGSHCVGVNLDRPVNDFAFHEFHLGKAGEILPELVDSWIEVLNL